MRESRRRNGKHGPTEAVPSVELVGVKGIASPKQSETDYNVFSGVSWF